jgi:2-polyprenyl-3-methyl-5-hydroxy-6-metoxy-1,4-benzoquinol methylase
MSKHPYVDGTQAHPHGSAVRAPEWPYVDKGDDPWSSHSRIKRWLAELPAGTRILDVGAATGTLGRMCDGAGFVLHGIEPNPDWAKLARPYYAEIVCGMLDDVPDAFIGDHDLVVCADVLEHMSYPEVALRRLVALQSMGCRFIISVPNVANIWVRLNLLLGRFNYTERGILDRTHLRFFTRRSLTAMLSSIGLRIVRFDVTPIPLNLVSPLFQRTAGGRFLHTSLALATGLRPTLLGYQFIVQATQSTSGGWSL